MSDNVTVTAGAGTAIAADNISSVFYQRVKPAFGADGSAADVSDANPLPVKGSQTVVKLAPTVTAGAYAAGDVVGGELTLTSAMRTSGGSGILHSLLVYTEDGETPELLFLIFDSAPGASLADNAAYAWTSGDWDKLLGVVKVLTADYQVIGGDGVASLRAIGLPVKASGSADLFCYIVCTGAPTFAATTDLTLLFGFLTD
jgi:hypothetical protein